VGLREVQPQVLRILDVPAGCTLPELHAVLQVGLGWTDSHLHQFVTDRARYGGRSDLWADEMDDEQDEDGVLLRTMPQRFTYLYDFGDGWTHDVEILGPGGSEPGCVFGEGACPPEDCGGPSGYEQLLEVLAHPEHEEFEETSSWAGSWEGRSGFDQDVTHRLVQNTVGAVPASVRLVLGLLDGGVRLTPGGRLPRTVVRAVQQERSSWCPWGKPASLEGDLLPLSDLHEALRRVGLARLNRGVLSLTKAATDDVQIVRRLRTALRPDSFEDLLAGAAVARLVLDGPQQVADLADAVYPYLGRGWAVGDRPVAPADVRSSLSHLGPLLQALDLVEGDWSLWRAGSSSLTLLPRATALAHIWAPSSP
jgi:hypothetical protein